MLDGEPEAETETDAGDDSIARQALTVLHSSNARSAMANTSRMRARSASPWTVDDSTHSPRPWTSRLSPKLERSRTVMPAAAMRSSSATRTHCIASRLRGRRRIWSGRLQAYWLHVASPAMAWRSSVATGIAAAGRWPQHTPAGPRGRQTRRPRRRPAGPAARSAPGPRPCSARWPGTAAAWRQSAAGARGGTGRLKARSCCAATAGVCTGMPSSSAVASWRYSSQKRRASMSRASWMAASCRHASRNDGDGDGTASWPSIASRATLRRSRPAE